MMKLEQSYKERAVQFLQLIVSGQIRNAFSKYASPELIHHNPFFPSDVESLMSAMEANHTQFPHKILEVRHAVQEGEIVAIFSHVRLKAGDLGLALTHIFKFEDDLIVELWDAGQAVPENSPNKLGMF